MRPRVLALLLLSACGPVVVTFDKDAPRGDDTGDTDAGDTGGDETGTDSETGSPETFELTFVVSGAADADVVQLDWLTETFTVLGALAAAPIVGGTARVEVSEPDPADLIELAPGTYGRYALPHAFDDADGDGVHDPGEVIGGAGVAWVLYLTGVIPFEFAAIGLVSGWNAVYVDTDPPLLADVAAIPLPLDLVPVETATLGGDVGVAFGADAQLALIPSVAFDGLPYGTLLYNQGLGADWSITVDGPPPDLHVADLFGTGIEAAAEVPLAWDDADGDALPGDTETLLGPACLEDEVVALLWLAPPTDPTVAYAFRTQGVRSGWAPVRETGTDEFAPLTELEATSLTIGGGCSF